MDFLHEQDVSYSCILPKLPVLRFSVWCFKLQWTPCESHDWHWAHAKNRGVCVWLKLHKNITYSLMQRIPALLQAVKWFPERTELPNTAAKGTKHLDILLEKYIKKYIKRLKLHFKIYTVLVQMWNRLVSYSSRSLIPSSADCTDGWMRSSTHHPSDAASTFLHCLERDAAE